MIRRHHPSSTPRRKKDLSPSRAFSPPVIVTWQAGWGACSPPTTPSATSAESPAGRTSRRSASPGSTSPISHYYGGTPTPGAASIERALLHLRRCAGDEAFFAAYESAWRTGKLSRPARVRIRAALPRVAHWLVDLARADADSGLESLLRLRLHLLGIRLECQVKIDGVGRVDFVIAHRIILEADGDENHGSSSSRHRDRMRDAIASRLGYETLRFDYAQIVHDWPAVQAAILGAMRRVTKTPARA